MRQALRRTAQENATPLRVLDAVEEANAAQKTVLIDKVKARSAVISRVVVLRSGAAFKPNTDDMREAPARTMIEALWAMGATVAAYDPAAMHETRTIYGERSDLILTENSMDALQDADALLVVTEWKARSPTSPL